MSIAALITWVVTALGGFVLLGTWIARGGARKPSNSRFSPALIFGHFALAAAGLVVWIVYLFADNSTLAWVAFALLVPVALLGFTMLVRWIPVYRTRAVSAAAGSSAGQVPAEQHFPVVVVGAHGAVAVATVVLVLLTALGVGGS